MIRALRYYDTLVKVDGSWLFAERLLYVDWLVERTLACSGQRGIVQEFVGRFIRDFSCSGHTTELIFENRDIRSKVESLPHR